MFIRIHTHNTHIYTHTYTHIYTHTYTHREWCTSFKVIKKVNLPVAKAKNLSVLIQPDHFFA